MMRKMVCCIFLCAACVSGVSAQSDKKVAAWFRQAQEAFRGGKSGQALELLDKVQVVEREFTASYLLQADIFNKKGEKEKEMQAIETAVAIDSLKGHPYYFFVLAEGYFDRGEYARAQRYYQLYLRKDVRQRAAGQVRKQLENCTFALNALQTQVKQPTEIYLQAPQSVYWPSLDVTGQTLLFTEQIGEQETMWMLKDSVRHPLNFETTGNFGAPSLTADGRMMYFSMNGGRNGFDIYVSYRLADSVWSEPVNLGYPVNTDGWDAQPAISADGSKLYFASNREGGRGGSDIWFSRLLKREPGGRQIWSQPKYLYFNTAGDEMAPFLYFDHKTLFFASNGYPGMGRKDIYKVDIQAVSKPLNIGITVNTQKEEFGFLVDGSGELGYFSSDVSGKRCIYRYQLDRGVACPPAAYVRLQVQNEYEEAILPDRMTVVEVATGDTLACYDEIYVHKDMLACVPSNTLLLVSAVKRGYMYYSDTLHVATADYVHPQVKVVMMREIREDRSLVLKGVFFDVDDYRLKPESGNELQQLVAFMKLNPDVRIEISGHTDNSGSDEHNRRLSEDRAFEVYKHLFLNHVAKERMNYKGYGKDQPIAPNDTAEGKAKNRRTEIKIEKAKGGER